MSNRGRLGVTRSSGQSKRQDQAIRVTVGTGPDAAIRISPEVLAGFASAAADFDGDETNLFTRTTVGTGPDAAIRMSPAVLAGLASAAADFEGDESNLFINATVGTGPDTDIQVSPELLALLHRQAQRGRISYGGGGVKIADMSRSPRSRSPSPRR